MPRLPENSTKGSLCEGVRSRSDLVEVKGRRYILVAVEGEATVNKVEVNIP